MSTALLTAHRPGSVIVTRAELEQVPTPDPTNRWKPISHASIPTLVEHFVENRGWQFRNNDDENRFKFALAASGDKLFGVTEIIIPGIDDIDFGMAIGFRNSHNKTLALRVAIGVKVFVCDNLMMSGDIQIRRIHTTHIDPYMVMENAFMQIPAAAENLTKWMTVIRHIGIDKDGGIALLADAVEVKALPIQGFMGARDLFLKSYDNGSEEIHHGGTVWSAYQSITAQYKKVQLDRNQDYSTKLNNLFHSRYNHVALPAPRYASTQAIPVL